MKISELIDYLEDCLEKQGDVEIEVELGGNVPVTPPSTPDTVPEPDDDKLDDFRDIAKKIREIQEEIKKREIEEKGDKSPYDPWDDTRTPINPWVKKGPSPPQKWPDKKFPPYKLKFDPKLLSGLWPAKKDDDI